MLPMFVLADSDIEEEELKPVLIKLKKRLKKKASRTGDVYVTITNNNVDSTLDDSSSASSDSLNNTDISIASEKQKKSVTDGINKKTTKRKTIENEDVIKSKVSIYPCSSCGKPCYHGYLSTVQHKRQSGKISCICEESATTTRMTVLESSIIVSPQILLTDLSSKIVALDCEFVGVGPKKLSALGRCSIVNYHGDIMLDIYAYPDDVITDYRTPWSGIRKKDLKSAVPFELARNTILKILRDKIVVGHAVFNDFKVMKISHPVECVRDTFSFKPLRERSSALGQGYSLKKLTKALLGRDIQTGEHCSHEDAKAALDLYKLVQSEWEEKLASKNKKVQTEIPLNCNTLFLGDEFWPSTLLDKAHQSSI